MNICDKVLGASIFYKLQFWHKHSVTTICSLSIQ